MLVSLDQLKEMEYSYESLVSFMPGVHIDVTPTGIIELSGLRTKHLEKDVKKIWKTSKILNIFNSKFRSVRFDPWFAVDVAYIFDRLIKEGPVSRRSNYSKALKLLYENTWLKKTIDKSVKPIDLDYKYMRSMLKLDLFDYQSAWFKSFAETVPRYDLSGYMAEAGTGSGKTLLGYAFHLATRADLTIFLVHKPTQESVWEPRIEKYFKKPMEFWTSSKGGRLKGNEDFMIVHHDYINKLVDMIPEISKKFGKKINIWIDESHKFTEETAQRVQHLYTLVDKLKPDYTIHASATPLKARPSEAIPLFRTICRGFNEVTAEKYKRVYGASKASALDVLNNRLGTVKFKVTSDEYLKINETTEEIKITFPGAEKYTLSAVREVMLEEAAKYIEQYENEKEDIVEDFQRLHKQVLNSYASGADRAILNQYYLDATEMHDGFRPIAHRELMSECKQIELAYHYEVLKGEDKKRFKYVASRYKYYVLVLRGLLLGNVMGGMRIECFSKMAVNMELEVIIESAKKKTIVFSSYVQPAKAAFDYAVGKGFKPELVTQETNYDLTNILKRFRNDPKVNPIVATTHSLGTGVEVVEASSAVFIDVPPRAYIYNQTKGRIARATQDVDVNYYECILDTGEEPNLSTRGLDILKWSQEQVDQMLGIEGDVIDVDDMKEFEPDLFESMMRKVLGSLYDVFA